MLRPSSLPALQQCPRFESGLSSVAAGEGTARHAALKENLEAALKEYLEVNYGLYNELEREQRDAVLWAAGCILTHAPIADYPIAFEVPVNPLGEDFKPLFPNGGTADVVCGPYIADLKWRRRDYTAQMAAYALDRHDAGHEVVTVDLLFADLADC